MVSEKKSASRGALYIAYGDRAREQAIKSIETLRYHAPSLPVAVVSDSPLSDVELIQRPEADLGARTWKTQMYHLSPFEQTLFLDADTEIRSSPSAGFSMLDYVDLVLAQDVMRVFADNTWPHLNREEVAATKSEIKTAQHMYYNSGVIFFRRNERVKAMMTAWHEEWQRWKMHDQMALLRAIHRCPVRIAPMRELWNTNKAPAAVFVYHKHRRARREGAPR